METKFGISNFAKGNTPQWLQKLGNICLILAGVGTAILAAPETLASVGILNVALPAFLITTGKVFVGVGVFSKIVTKLFGEPEVKTETKDEANSK